MLTWAVAWWLKGSDVSGDAGCLVAFAMLFDVIIVVAVAAACAYVMTR